MVQGKINRGRHTDYPAGRHSSRTNQSHLHHPPIIYRPDALPAVQPTVSKHNLFSSCSQSINSTCRLLKY